MFKFLAVFIGGGIGSIARYALSILFQNVNSKFPFATILSNFLSCLIMGLFILFISEKIISSSIWRLLLIVGPRKCPYIHFMIFEETRIIFS